MRNMRVHPRPEYGTDSSAQFFRLRFRTLELPAVRDGVVIGRCAPITSDAMLQTLRLMSAERFAELPAEDETVVSVIVREGILKRVSAETILQFVLERVKPYMSDTEVLRLDIDLEILLEGSV